MNRLFIPLYLLAFVCLLGGCVGKTVVANNLPEREANEIVVLLNSKGIAAAKTAAPVSAVGGAASSEVLWDISVPPDKITESLAVLNHAGLPRTKGKSLLDLFGTSGLVPSDFQDKIRYQEGLSEQLANTLRKMDGVIDADVQITFPSTEGETQVPLSASVYVKHRGLLDNPNCLMITKIKRLVSCAVPGLSVDNVCVVPDRALLAEISFPELPPACEMQEYISIWGIVIAKSSTALFRTIFYIFLIAIFLCICLIAWMFWKFFPALETYGGFKYFITLHRAKPTSEEAEQSESEAENEEKK